MAIRDSHEILIEASPVAITDALADVESLPEWTAAYRRVEVIDRYDDGRPHHIRVAIKVLGLVDNEVLEYHWGPNWLVWDADRTGPQHGQHGQHVEYTLHPDPDGSTTRVRIDVTVETASPIPLFLIKKASRAVLDAASDGLRRRVLGDNISDPPE